ncbi:MAG: heat-inducible transcription repressor HrcA [Nitrospina sp.]|jgi:heat-inducible transcriptional repressor|nr:heat-inducible transcription repressor HrcA [Nitrospina sp.]MBT5633545.1 heat-inducible transcription repressor HrcA [Nitrospina sp.]
MSSSILDERNKAVLLAVIDKYIETAEPVGSRTLAKVHPEHLSSATLRNAMADLEDRGFLSQPHKSAGRIPTDKGYRFYVDHLLRPQSFLMTAEVLAHELEYPLEKKNLQGLLEQACENLSKVSQQTGLVMLPSFSSACFKHIEFTKVAPQAALAVFFSEQGILQNKVLPIDADMTQDQLTSISNYLNSEFSGKPIKWILRELLKRLKLEKEHYNQLAGKAHALSAALFSEEKENSELIVEGALNFLDQPEFTEDISKIKALLFTLEEKTKLVNLLDLCLHHDGMTILIGEENLQEEMGDCSLIAQNYQLGNENVGTLAVFGSKRMDYKRIISIVNNTAKIVSKLISENQGV